MKRKLTIADISRITTRFYAKTLGLKRGKGESWERFSLRVSAKLILRCLEREAEFGERILRRRGVTTISGGKGIQCPITYDKLKDRMA